MRRRLSIEDERAKCCFAAVGARREGAPPPGQGHHSEPVVRTGEFLGRDEAAFAARLCHRLHVVVIPGHRRRARDLHPVRVVVCSHSQWRESHGQSGLVSVGVN